MIRRKFGKNVIVILISSFILATIVFISIFFLADSISYLNYQGIEAKNNILNEYISLGNERLDNFVCDNRLFEESSKSLDEISMKLSLLEERFGKKDIRVLEQKKLYSEIEILHYKLIKRFEEDCNLDFITVIFFYNNEGKLEEKSERIGFILTSFKKEAPRKVLVYSFDYNLNCSAVNYLKEKYDIKSNPCIVINEKDILYPKNIEELEKYLN